MEFKHKEFILGLILGGFIFTSISTFADEIYNVIINPFKVTVNGTEKNIEGYNINGSTYFKLRDIGKYVGFNVDFENEVIQIETTNQIDVKSSNTQKGFYDTVFEIWDNTHKLNNIAIIEKNGEIYLEGGMVSCIGTAGSTVDKYYKVMNNIVFRADDNYMWLDSQSTGETLTEKIPIYEINNNLYIKQSDFENTIKPQIDIILDENGIQK